MRLTELVTPLKPLEAMALERLVVASDVGGHKELIEDKKNGYLFRANDADALANTVLTLLNSQAQWDKTRRNGRNFVEQQRNWPMSVAAYEKLYNQLHAG
jgi:glycosyltransferase involved in cell wall biosynthesis